MAEEIKNGLTETEPNEYRKNRLRLNPKKKRYCDFELNCLNPEEHDELWNIVNDALSETMRAIEKITSRISFHEKLIDPGNIEEDERYLENTR